MEQGSLIIFDGECKFCSDSVRFVIEHDKKALFAFIHLNSVRARSLIAQYGLDPNDLDTVILLKDDKAYVRSQAVFEIIKELDGAWPLLRLLSFLPVAFNDLIYRCFAKNRHKIFSKSKKCEIPPADIASRFLSDK